MKRMRIFAATALAILIGISLSCAQVKKQLTEAEAIRVAEKFVAENGYTDLPPAQDKTKLSFEGIDASDPEERLRTRYNSLERKAYGAGGGSIGEYGWTIVFHYNAKNERYRQIIPNFDQHLEEVGRAVTMLTSAKSGVAGNSKQGAERDDKSTGVRRGLDYGSRRSRRCAKTTGDVYRLDQRDRASSPGLRSSRQFN